MQPKAMSRIINKDETIYLWSQRKIRKNTMQNTTGELNKKRFANYEIFLQITLVYEIIYRKYVVRGTRTSSHPILPISVIYLELTIIKKHAMFEEYR